MLSKAWATSRASMSGVPLKSMCSMRCEMPATSSLSSRLPARIQTPKETLVASGKGSEETRSPVGSLFSLMLGSLKSLVLQLLQRDAVLLVYVEHPHLHAVALVHHVLDAFDPLLARGEAGDVDQPVAARHQLDEGAEVRGLDHLAGIDVARFDVLGHGVDRRHRRLHRDAVDAGNEDRAVVLHGDRDAVLLLQGVYGLAAGADEEPYLVRRYRELLDPRGEVRDLGARLGDGCCHDVQDLEPALLRLIQRLPQKLGGDPGDLHVHLQGRDAVACSGHLEVDRKSVV